MSALAEARARNALADAGLNSDVTLIPLRSVTNEVWVAGEYIVRLNRRQDHRLQREAALAPMLPADLGYPEVVHYGGEIGADHLIVRRVPGRVLSQCWPQMSVTDRRTAVKHLAQMLRSLHAFTCTVELPGIDSPPLLSSTPANPAAALLAALDEGQQLANVDPGVMMEARNIVIETAPSLEPFDTPTFVHGDLHFDNVLWDGQQVTTLLDFKWARPCAPDLELDVFLRYCAFPFLHVSEDFRQAARPEDYADVPFVFADHYPELFSVRRQFDRMRLYSLAYDVRELLLFPPPVPADQLSEHHPYNRLRRTLGGQSHIDVLAQGVPA
jgi:aminoglycoside phosphotransferase (APT) family kinase protein